MRKIIIILLIFLVGCTSIELSSECSRYANVKEISELAGVYVGMPDEILENEYDCAAMYKRGNSEFYLYYWTYSSDDSHYTTYNHSLIYTSNCEGSLCDSLYDFHYSGPPRDLEVTCKDGKIWMNDKGNIKEKEIDCTVLKNIGKHNQKTWKCDYNAIIRENCE